MHDRSKITWHWISHVALLCSIATLCLLLVSMTKPIVNVETIQVNLQQCQAIELTTTGYPLGKPYASVTKSGNPVISLGFAKMGNINIFSVAVDPKLIPLGSRVFIPGLGIGDCMDTGEEIKGLDLDICFKTAKEANEWGRQKKWVYILERGPKTIKGVSNESEI